MSCMGCGEFSYTRHVPFPPLNPSVISRPFIHPRASDFLHSVCLTFSFIILIILSTPILRPPFPFPFSVVRRLQSQSAAIFCQPAVLSPILLISVLSSFTFQFSGSLQSLRRVVNSYTALEPTRQRSQVHISFFLFRAQLLRSSHLSYEPYFDAISQSFRFFLGFLLSFCLLHSVQCVQSSPILLSPMHFRVPFIVIQSFGLSVSFTNASDHRTSSFGFGLGVLCFLLYYLPVTHPLMPNSAGANGVTLSVAYERQICLHSGAVAQLFALGHIERFC